MDALQIKFARNTESMLIEFRLLIALQAWTEWRKENICHKTKKLSALLILINKYSNTENTKCTFQILDSIQNCWQNCHNIHECYTFFYYTVNT